MISLDKETISPDLIEMIDIKIEEQDISKLKILKRGMGEIKISFVEPPPLLLLHLPVLYDA